MGEHFLFSSILTFSLKSPIIIDKIVTLEVQPLRSDEYTGTLHFFP
jgi:hypothetical protein